MLSLSPSPSPSPPRSPALSVESDDDHSDDEDDHLTFYVTGSSPTPIPSRSSSSSIHAHHNDESREVFFGQDLQDQQLQGEHDLSPTQGTGLSTYHSELATSPITSVFSGPSSYMRSLMSDQPPLARGGGYWRPRPASSKRSSNSSFNPSVNKDAIHEPLSPTHMSPAQLYTTASGQLFHAGKICIVIAGLPARGKTHLAVSLTRYLRWLGVKTHAFHLGDYRRQFIPPNMEVPDDYFMIDASASTVMLRQRVMAACKVDLYRFFDSENGQVAVYDAVNPTAAGRRVLVKELNQHGIQVLFIESICDRPEIIEANVRSVKISSPDYAGWNENEAVEDYLTRISLKVPLYESMDMHEHEFSYIKLYNAGERILLNNTRVGYLPNRIVFYLMNLHIKKGSVYFARAGRSTERRPKYKSDPHLNEEGTTYSKVLADTLIEYRKKEHEARIGDGELEPNAEPRELIVWTSTRRRTIETASEFEKRGVRCRQRPQLSQMHPGLTDGLGTEEIERLYPDEVAEHVKDPYRHRFPRAESYHDLAVRMEPVILEMERISSDILIIAHVSVLRVLYGYLMACLPFEIPALEFERNEIVEIIPSAYNNQVKRIVLPGIPPNSSVIM
ncbi:6-phosphofructo-2-kinase-domain-containing protein [Lipomyces oligophaga]|uniref:6-phosphofructo-2-kinase-domain-containing protein n=1 Tax=Lipomyces oligophaga TaxID=45792 RepID=UPI0034CFCFE3